jgi:hypothetical protein
LRGEEHEADATVVVVPPVVRVAVVGVEEVVALVRAQTEQVRIAVQIRVMCREPSMPLPFEYSNGLYRIWHRNALALCTKYSSFLKFLRISLYLKP